MSLFQVNFTSPGVYNIYTDTSNGFSFRDSGYMFNSGLQTIKLKSVGKPLLTQLTGFNVTLDTSTHGTYKTNRGVTTLFSLNNTTETGDPIYTSNNTTPVAIMSIVIVSYDTASKLVTGTFGGNVMNESTGRLVAITNGKFSAVVQ